MSQHIEPIQLGILVFVVYTAIFVTWEAVMNTGDKK